MKPKICVLHAGKEPGARRVKVHAVAIHTQSVPRSGAETLESMTELSNFAYLLAAADNRHKAADKAVVRRLGFRRHCWQLVFQQHQRAQLLLGI